jgi:DNA-binding response OmpR family regulator
MIVEDDPTLRMTIAEALTEDGYAVEAAADGATALDMVQHWPPDLVILDLMMPRLDGEGFCIALRGIQGMAAVPIVVISASRVAAQFGARIGAAATLSKPFDLLELMRFVDRLLQTTP